MQYSSSGQQWLCGNLDGREEKVGVEKLNRADWSHSWSLPAPCATGNPAPLPSASPWKHFSQNPLLGCIQIRWKAEERWAWCYRCCSKNEWRRSLSGSEFTALCRWFATLHRPGGCKDQWAPWAVSHGSCNFLTLKADGDLRTAKVFLAWSLKCQPLSRQSKHRHSLNSFLLEIPAKLIIFWKIPTGNSSAPQKGQ